jgi:hypothetical protein
MSRISMSWLPGRHTRRTAFASLDIKVALFKVANDVALVPENALVRGGAVLYKIQFSGYNIQRGIPTYMYDSAIGVEVLPQGFLKVHL